MSEQLKDTMNRMAQSLVRALPVARASLPLPSDLRTAAWALATMGTLTYWLYPLILEVTGWSCWLILSLLYGFWSLLFSSGLYGLVSHSVAFAGFLVMLDFLLFNFPSRHSRAGSGVSVRVMRSGEASSDLTLHEEAEQPLSSEVMKEQEKPVGDTEAKEQLPVRLEATVEAEEGEKRLSKQKKNKLKAEVEDLVKKERERAKEAWLKDIQKKVEEQLPTREQEEEQEEERERIIEEEVEEGEEASEESSSNNEELEEEEEENREMRDINVEVAV